jgi:hypothetical protein
MNKPPKWITPERTALGVRMWENGTPIVEIKLALDGLPGHDMTRTTYWAIQRHIEAKSLNGASKEKAEPIKVDCRFRNILMHVGPEFPRVDIGKVWPDALIDDVNQWRAARDHPPVRVVGP